jgi:acetyl-CoA carboxylase biotin carboxylase subunit
MDAAGVPVVPGTKEPVTDADDALDVARRLTFPVMLKAAAGGGGKGMRRVDRAEDVAAAFRAATSEAEAAFGDGSVYVEQYIARPRHVEIQVLADRFGHVVHLGERECSIQRRHQKLIEEAPSPAVDIDLRMRMGEAAVQAARAVGYLGAGTVEFLLAADGQFYFLEMNTRIQVEHPVTELVYGVDLVREQLRIAGGEPTTVPGRALRPRGHAIECRITSEDPFNGFLPATGRIVFLKLPTGPGVRWDGGIDQGGEVGTHYDPLLGKLIVWGENRDRALARLRRALEEFVLVGLPTSQPFHRRILDDPGFIAGTYDIGFLEQFGEALLAAPPADDDLERAALAVALAEHETRQAAVPVSEPAGQAESAWARAARRAGRR